MTDYSLAVQQEAVSTSIRRLRAVIGAPLAQQVATTALDALVETGKTTATCRAVERFLEPGYLGNVVTRLVVVTDLTITLS
jgi:hypothetical protein